MLRRVRWLIALVGLCLALAPRQQAQASSVRLTSGSTTGTYYAVSKHLEELFGHYARSTALQVNPSGGSVDNVHRLLDGRADLAIMQADVLSDAVEGIGRFATPHPELRTLALLYPETLHLVVREGIEATSPKDLIGRRVGLGPAGGGTASTAWLLLDAYDIKPSDITAERGSSDEQLDQLLAGELDAFFTMIAAPATRVQRALAAGGALVPIDAEVVRNLVAERTFLFTGDLDLGVYGQPGKTLAALQVPSVLTSGPELSGEQAYDILATLATTSDSIRTFRPALNGFDLSQTAEHAPVSIHPGALAFLEASDFLDLPVEVHTGMYIRAISELDLSDGTFLLDANLWFRWKGPMPTGDRFDFDIVNGTIETIDDGKVERHGGWNWQTNRVIARVRGNFLLHDYPFDRQVLPVYIEHATLEADKLIFVPDQHDGAYAGHLLDPAVEISDWRIDEVTTRIAEHHYPLHFGEKRTDDHVDSRFILEVQVARAITPYLVKFAVPLIVIVLMSFTVFFIQAREFEVQSAITVTALLSCVAFHISQADSLPEVGYLVTADKFFMVSYLVIFAVLLQVVWENNLYHAGRADEAERLDTYSRIIYPTVFFGPLLYLLIRSAG